MAANKVVPAKINVNDLHERLFFHQILKDEEAEWDRGFVLKGKELAEEDFNHNLEVDTDELMLLCWTWVPDDVVDADLSGLSYCEHARPPHGTVLQKVSEGSDPGAYVAFAVSYKDILERLHEKENKYNASQESSMSM